MANGILSQIQHIVVVMLENRSLDNMCGWLYTNTTPPALYLPSGSAQQYDGLNTGLWNPSNPGYFNGQPPVQVPVAQGTTNYFIPNPDPEETFDNVTYQLYGPAKATLQTTMKGFVVNYQYATAGDADQIMQGYTPNQVPVISQLARNYAISDAWFCSVPSQTWPNRAFVHAGTSNGNVNNGNPPDPLKWDVNTIFNVLKSLNVSWNVYSDAEVAPSLTRTMFPKLWDPFLDGHFHGFTQFQQDCANGALPKYSFIEPNFLDNPNDEHPPHDVSAGEAFLLQIWQAVSTSPNWGSTLLIITYDEHGGCYDHVLPPQGALPPDKASDPGQENFKFNRFGVRVSTVLVSPYIQAGTVFRSNTSVAYDHTSILATLRDWIGISPSAMLPSKRIAAAPNVAQVLTLTTPRSDVPMISPLRVAPQPTSLSLPPNDLQKSLVAGAARRFGMDPALVLPQIRTRQHAVDFFKVRPSHAHA
jgi:phospholipase C